MTWTKVSDSMLDDPVLLALPRGARLLHLEGLVFANKHGTDGAVPRHVLSRITDEPDPPAAAELLVVAGLWAVTDAGWQIATFLKDQPAAADVEKARALAALRTRRWNLHRDGDHSLCRSGWCKKADASSDASANASDDVYRPARPARKGKGREGGMDRRPAAARSPGGRSRPSPPEKVNGSTLAPVSLPPRSTELRALGDRWQSLAEGAPLAIKPLLWNAELLSLEDGHLTLGYEERHMRDKASVRTQTIAAYIASHLGGTWVVDCAMSHGGGAP